MNNVSLAQDVGIDTLNVYSLNNIKAGLMSSSLKCPVSVNSVLCAFLARFFSNGGPVTWD